MKKEQSTLSAAPQEALHRDASNWIFNAALFVLAFLLLHELISKNVTPTDAIPSPLKELLGLKLLSAEATTALIAGLVTVKYLVRQISISYRPYITFSTTFGPVDHLPIGRGVRTIVSNAGTGASGATDLAYKLKLKDEVYQEFRIQEQLLQYFSDMGFAEGEDIFMPRIGVSGGILPNSSITYFEGSQRLLEALDVFEVVMTFEGLFGGRFRKEIFFYPRRWKLYGVPGLQISGGKADQ